MSGQGGRNGTDHFVDSTIAPEKQHRPVFAYVEPVAFELLACDVDFDILVHEHEPLLSGFLVETTLGRSCSPFQSPQSCNPTTFREEPFLLTWFLV